MPNFELCHSCRKWAIYSSHSVCVWKLKVDSNTQTYLTTVIKDDYYILYHQSKLMHTKSVGIISLLNVK